MARKKMNPVNVQIHGGELPEHVHTHVMGFHAQKTRPDMVVTVLELHVAGGRAGGQVFYVAVCPHCLLKIAEVTDKLVELYPEAFQELAVKSVKQVTDQIDKVFADRSVPASETRMRLEAILEYTQERLDALLPEVDEE